MILLDVGADAVVPPAGKRSLILDADGVPFLLAPDGTRTEIGSGGGGGTVEAVVAGTGIDVDDTDPANPIVSNTGVLSATAGTGIAVSSAIPTAPVISLAPAFDVWLAAMADFVAARDAALTGIQWTSDCQDWSGMDRVALTGTTATAALVRISGSLRRKLRLASGAGANSFRPVRNRALARPAAASVQNDLVTNVRTVKYAVCARVIVNVVHATCTLYGVNMSDEATQDTYIGVLGSTSQVNFVLKIGSAAVQDTGVAIGTLGTSEHDLILLNDGTNTSAYIDLNTTAAASGLSNTSANAAGHVNLLAANGATAANASIDILHAAVFVV